MSLIVKLRTRLYVALVLGTLPTSLLAQTISLGPSLGYYRPLGRFRATNVLSTDLPTVPSGLAGLAWGGELGIALQQRVRIQAAFSTIASTLPTLINPGFATAINTHERVNVVTLEAQYALISGHAISQLLVGVGPTFVQHRGEGYARHGAPRSFGAAGGVEFVRGVTHALQLAADLGTAIYSMNVPNPPQHGTQFDALLTLSARWRINLRGVSPDQP